jgi:hypothetical protein
VTLVAAVDCFRPDATVRAVRACRVTTDGEVDDLAAQLYLLDHEPGTRRQQHLRIHRPPLGWPDDPSGRRGLPEYSSMVQLARANLDISLAAARLVSLGQVCLESLSRLVSSLTTTACTKFAPDPAFMAASVQVPLTIDRR